MRIVEFINPNNHAIELRGPGQERIRLKKGEKKVLSEWYMKYVPKYIKPINSRNVSNVKTIKVKKVQATAQDKAVARKQAKIERRSRLIRGEKAQASASARERRRVRSQSRRQKAPSRGRSRRYRIYENSGIVTQYYNKLMELCRVHESNDIGVGILSYNRLDCVKKLIGSIRRYTDLTKITVVVSDESSKPGVKQWLSDQKDIVFLNNKDRIGIAGNTNRLLRCLERFKYKLILNDDVEVLSKGWEQVYISIMKETGYHHFCMRQPGVYGASRKDGRISTVKDLEVQTVTSKPHGAVLALDDVAFDKVGYFDESYGKYGIEHVDWSNRVSLSGIQPAGFHDVVGTEKFFKIENRSTSIPQPEKSKGLSDARIKYNSHKSNKSRIYIKPTDKSKVPGVTFVIPFSGKDRMGMLRRTINNIKSLDYPRIEIIVVEEERDPIDFDIAGVRRILVKPKHNMFCKAMCINRGVSEVRTGITFIHDADMLCEFDYIRTAVRVMRVHDAAHIGKNVIYLDANNKPHKMLTGFVGGSIICRKNKFFEAGGFDELFYGHGYEDKDFYDRIEKSGSFFDGELANFVHLYHVGCNKYMSRSKINQTLCNKSRKKGDNIIDKLRAELKKNGFKR
jgi:GT2 family glycosyltransferase